MLASGRPLVGTATSGRPAAGSTKTRQSEPGFTFKNANFLVCPPAGGHARPVVSGAQSTSALTTLKLNNTIRQTGSSCHDTLGPRLARSVGPLVGDATSGPTSAAGQRLDQRSNRWSTQPEPLVDHPIRCHPRDLRFAEWRHCHHLLLPSTAAFRAGAAVTSAKWKGANDTCRWC